MVSFRERFETLYPVVIRRVSISPQDLKDSHDWGDTSLATKKGDQYLLVRIEKRLSPEATILVAAHELAHCIQWRANEDTRKNDHDPEWGIAIARIWSELFAE